MATALSEYEQQRLKNMEENRRILESIRQEQLYSFPSTEPKAKPKTAAKKPTTGPKTQKKKKTVERSKVKEEADGADTEEPDKENATTRRKSARLQGKRARYTAGDGTEEDEEQPSDEEFNVRDEDDDDDEDEYADSADDDDEEGSRKRRRGSSRPKKPQKIARTKTLAKVPKDRPNHYGAVAGVPIGRCWLTRLECCADGIHRPTVAGIHGGPDGAYSIALSGGYEDDLDLGDCFTYTGEGGRELKGTKNNPKNLRTAPQSKDQTLTRGNLALSLNVASKYPVRVIRGYKLKTEFAPEEGYRYDGLYSVEKFWDCQGKAGFKVFKFALRRLPDQDPPPWVYTNPNAQKAIEPKEEPEDDADEEVEDQKPPKE